MKSIYLLLIFIIFLFTSCNNDDDNVTANSTPIEQVYENIVPQEFLELIVNTCEGAVVVTGANPPENLIGKEFTNRCYLTCSTIEGDELGTNFNNVKFNISNFNSSNFTCSLSMTEVNSDYEIEKAYFLGEENKFSVFAKIYVSINAQPEAQFLVLLTGEYTAEGVKNVRHYIQSVKVPEGTGNTYILEGGYRSFAYSSTDNENTVSPFND